MALMSLCCLLVRLSPIPFLPVIFDADESVFCKEKANANWTTTKQSSNIQPIRVPVVWYT